MTPEFRLLGVAGSDGCGYYAATGAKAGTFHVKAALLEVFALIVFFGGVLR